MIVVSDASAISALLHIQEADLLRKQYSEVFIPAAVRDELAVAHASLPEFIRVAHVVNRAYRDRLLDELDDGEAEAIVLAKELGADDVLIDESEGRRIAEREGVHVIGLIGVLLEARKRGLIPSMTEIILRLETKAHFHISQNLKETALREAGEL